MMIVLPDPIAAFEAPEADAGVELREILDPRDRR